MSYENGLLGVNYDEDYMRLNDKGELEPHPFIMGNRSYPGPTGSEFTAVGTLGAGVLYPVYSSVGQIFQAGTFGPFTKPDEKHPVLLEIWCDVRIFVYHIIESAFPDNGDGNNPFYQDTTTSVLLDLRLLKPIPETSNPWKTVARSTVTTDESARANSWYTETRPAWYSTSRNTGFIWEWRLRWVVGVVGAFPVNVSFTSGDFHVRAYPVTDFAAG